MNNCLGGLQKSDFFRIKILRTPSFYVQPHKSDRYEIYFSLFNSLVKKLFYLVFYKMLLTKDFLLNIIFSYSTPALKQTFLRYGLIILFHDVVRSSALLHLILCHYIPYIFYVLVCFTTLCYS